jgi:hypothetical protein
VKYAYSIDELVEDGPIGRSKIFEAIREKQLVARKLGRRTIILAADWRDFLEALPKATVSGDATVSNADRPGASA